MKSLSSVKKGNPPPPRVPDLLSCY
jgi:hypothetical protein